MKKIILPALAILLAFSSCYQKKQYTQNSPEIAWVYFNGLWKAAKEKIKEQIIALEKSGWEAWKNKNAEWFQTNTTPEFLSVNSQGISNKDQVVKSTSTDCNVKNFA